jgi:hypothetical protein
VIVVIGSPCLADRAGQAVPAGAAAAIALAAAAAGARVEVVGKVGDDPAGDAVLLAFGRSGVGHVATLRDPARPTPRLGTEAEIGDAVHLDEASTASVVSDAPEAPEAAVGLSLDGSDVSLAMRYLPEYAVIVVVHANDPAVLAEASAAAGWSGAHLVVVTDPTAGDDGPAGALVLALAPDDADGIAPLIGRYAAAVDAGTEPAAAFAGTLGAAADPA